MPLSNASVSSIGTRYRSFPKVLSAVNALTDAVMSARGVTVRAAGAATAVTLVVEQHPLGVGNTPPASNSPYWAPALAATDPAYTGNPAAGMAPDVYSDAAASWWRVRVTALTGASVEVIVSTQGF